MDVGDAAQCLDCLLDARCEAAEVEGAGRILHQHPHHLPTSPDVRRRASTREMRCLNATSSAPLAPRYPHDAEGSRHGQYCCSTVDV